MSDREHFRSKTPCKSCGAEIWLYKSNKGSFYPTNTEDARDFHKCEKKEQNITTAVTNQPQKSLDQTSQSSADKGQCVLFPVYQEALLNIKAIWPEYDNMNPDQKRIMLMAVMKMLIGFRK